MSASDHTPPTALWGAFWDVIVHAMPQFLVAAARELHRYGELTEPRDLAHDAVCYDPTGDFCVWISWYKAEIDADRAPDEAWAIADELLRQRLRSRVHTRAQALVRHRVRFGSIETEGRFVPGDTVSVASRDALLDDQRKLLELARYAARMRSDALRRVIDARLEGAPDPIDLSKATRWRAGQTIDLFIAIADGLDPEQRDPLEAEEAAVLDCWRRGFVAPDHIVRQTGLGREAVLVAGATLLRRRLKPPVLNAPKKRRP